MAEEHGCQTPEGHRLCANNCGFFGSPTTQNLCSKCYMDLFPKDQKSNPNKSHDHFLTLTPSSSIILPSIKKPEDVLLKISSPSPSPAEVDDVRHPTAAAEAVVVQPNRCTVCRKKVGLTGFKCRCGITFCGSHRYPEKHSCSFDFKAMGKEAIAKANPVIKADKLERI